MTRLAPVLFAVTDRQRATAEATLERFARLGQAARPGSVAFQLRDGELSARERLHFGRALRAVARATEQLVLVNDRLDLAVLLEADGVHLGEAGVATAEARRLLGERAFVSRACHDVSRVGSDDADAVLLSPVFEARKGRPALGIGALEAALEARGGRGAPAVFALGGVTAENAATCLAAGADGVAAIGAVLHGELDALVRALHIER
jgi:thiamine-phosphate pyrophosphorylase